MSDRIELMYQINELAATALNIPGCESAAHVLKHLAVAMMMQSEPEMEWQARLWMTKKAMQ